VAEIRALVLDYNGTLAEDDHLLAPLYSAGFASLGLELSTEAYLREFPAMPDREMFEVALRRAGRPVDDARRDALVDARVNGYLEAVRREPPITDDAAAFVRAAAGAGLRLAITTGAFRREIDAVLEAAGLGGCFTAVVTIDDVARGKPDPEGFLRAIELIGERSGPRIAPAEAVAIEDATDGARAARAAGMRVVAIRGFGYDDASGLADLVIDRLEPAALQSILALGDGR
jgi:beta-phosphoglucomutase